MRGVRGMSAQEVGLYTMLLCRMYEQSGPIEDHPLRLSTYCGMRQATFEKTLQKLVDLGKIIRADGVLWNERAEIEISHRANDLRIASKAGKESARKRQQNQSKIATPVQRTFNHTNTDTDTDIREDTKVSSMPRKRASRLSDDFQVPNEWIEWSTALGGGSAFWSNEADKFKDYWTAKSGKDATKANWQATWRNWCRNVMERSPPVSKPNLSPRIDTSKLNPDGSYRHDT